MINRVNYFLPLDILVTLYYSFIYLYISYCGSVWGNTYPSVTNKLKFAQNRDVKAVFQLPRLYPTHALYSDFDIISFDQNVKKLNLSLAYSAYHKNLPAQLLSYFNSNNSESLCLCSSHRSFIVPKCVSSSAQRSPIYKYILLWNIILSIVELSTSFRTLYKNVLKFWYYYSLNSYSIFFNYPCFLFSFFFSLFFIFIFLLLWSSTSSPPGSLLLLVLCFFFCFFFLINCKLYL